MIFNRRNFFATLLAPLAAKVGLSKIGHAESKPAAPVNMAHVSEIGEWVDFDSQTKLIKELWIDSPVAGRVFVAVGNGPFIEMVTPHPLPPFKIMHLELSPWQQEQTSKITIKSDGEPFKIYSAGAVNKP